MANAEVNPTDLWVLLISTVRYSMGRCSTAPAGCCDMIRAYGRYLQPAQLQQIEREIGVELARAESNGKTLGHQCDHDEWWKVVRFLGARRCAKCDRVMEVGASMDFCVECDLKPTRAKVKP